MVLLQSLNQKQRKQALRNYKVADLVPGPLRSGQPDGPWWFEAKWLDAGNGCTRGNSRQASDKVMEAIRPMLAICKDWNDLLRLITMTPGGEGILAVYWEKKTPTHRVNKSTHYDSSEKVFVIGGLPTGLYDPLFRLG